MKIDGMKTLPMEHQLRGFNMMDGKRNFALLMEQGTGKTWLTLADIVRCYLLNKIDGVLVIAPNGVHINWTRREIPTHVDLKTLVYTWTGMPTSQIRKKRLEDFLAPYKHVGRRPLTIMSINIDAVPTKVGFATCMRYVAQSGLRIMVVVDESTRIKNPSAVRTKKVIKVGREGIARRILSGTPMPRGPSDLYSQFDFLKPGLLGTTSYRSFVAQYTVLIEEDDPRMVAIKSKITSPVTPQIPEKDSHGMPVFKNLQTLTKMMTPHSFRVKKEECLDLPPKVYQPRYFELTPTQRKIYDRLEKDYEYLMGGTIEWNGEVFDTVMTFEAIAARSKLKQATSGFVNIESEPQLMTPEDNPRMHLFKEILEELDEEPETQFIVWCMFSTEIAQIKALLEEKGISCGVYDGATTSRDREQLVDDFQAGKVRAFIGQAQAAGIGITLTAATVAIYYSCSYDNELRMQSEDRCHRIGTKSTVRYIDLIGVDTIDEAITHSLAFKTALSEQVIDTIGK